MANKIPVAAEGSRRPLTASEYREKRQAKLAEEPTELVTVPKTGNTWRLRKVSLQTWIIGGEMPMYLARKMEAAFEARDEAAAQHIYESLTPAEQERFDEFNRRIVEAATVEPRIRLNPETENDLRPGEVDADDFIFILGWAFTGGTSAEALDQFRK